MTSRFLPQQRPAPRLFLPGILEPETYRCLARFVFNNKKKESERENGNFNGKLGASVGYFWMNSWDLGWIMVDPVGPWIQSARKSGGLDRQFRHSLRCDSSLPGSHAAFGSSPGWPGAQGWDVWKPPHQFLGVWELLPLGRNSLVICC